MRLVRVPQWRGISMIAPLDAINVFKNRRTGELPIKYENPQLESSEPRRILHHSCVIYHTAVRPSKHWLPLAFPGLFIAEFPTKLGNERPDGTSTPSQKPSPDQVTFKGTTPRSLPQNRQHTLHFGGGIAPSYL